MITGIYLGSLLIVVGCLVGSGFVGTSFGGRFTPKRSWQYSVGEGKWRYRDDDAHHELSKETRLVLGAFLVLAGVIAIVAGIVV
ncbi:hypothetical protein [Catenulispora sp. EB89]|uniref:hypothetical protein n=1 Tax=Catenulispora sp. EB89 TaxID=3156257 RepID=UPI0035135EDE